ncbi:transketolase [Roseiconus nitratireducens]|uniref:Transketolase n=2 Tax=Roseiconus nitratireducens TaxID=2605748 RepID=A0A5M6D8I1_9BACT|nr:transketolase [Roseiconus nitratireducens]
MQATSIDRDTLDQLARQIRRAILRSTTQAGSGHPTSSLSAVELMTALFFQGHFRFDADHPEHPNNDRLIFSKGHASPLFYSLWAAAGQVSSADLMTYRQFGSPIEGHPTSRFELTEAATGSLGQGLSIGLGMALNGQYLDRLPYRTFVLLGDSEMAEGSQWEAMELASHYQLNNLIGILDVNRLGQRGETMQGHDLTAHQRRIEAFGWETILIEDGHDLAEVDAAYRKAFASDSKRPKMLIAHTIKGKGVSFLEDQPGWHGKPLDEDQLQQALAELPAEGEPITGNLASPENAQPEKSSPQASQPFDYKIGDKVATRNAFGNAIQRLGPQWPNLVSLDGEVSNSTRAKFFAEEFPDRFFEMFVAEQNMAGAAIGLARRGKIPFVSSFAAFLTRAFDQIRMARYSDVNVKFVGSHCGVSIGQDGPSQMGLEDIAMFRTIQESVVLYPCDAVSAERLVEAMMQHHGISYLRTTRGKTPVLYDDQTRFSIGGCNVLRRSSNDQATLVAAGVTVHEALRAQETLQQDGIQVRVIDLYSIKPLDRETLRQAAAETEVLITIEDHFPEGGLGEAVRSAVAESTASIRSLAVRKRAMSGTPEELREDQGISADGIVKEVRSCVGQRVG